MNKTRKMVRETATRKQCWHISGQLTINEPDYNKSHTFDSQR